MVAAYVHAAKQSGSSKCTDSKPIFVSSRHHCGMMPCWAFSSFSYRHKVGIGKMARACDAHLVVKVDGAKVLELLGTDNVPQRHVLVGVLGEHLHAAVENGELPQRLFACNATSIAEPNAGHGEEALDGDVRLGRQRNNVSRVLPFDHAFNLGAAVAECLLGPADVLNACNTQFLAAYNSI